MFIVLLRFGDNKGQAGALMEGHKQWLDRGWADGVFLMVGSIQPNLGGAILAHNTSLPELRQRLNEDPFVAERVVTADIVDFSPSRADERLAFLLS